MPFDKLSLKELKELAKQHKDLIKGYTKMGKEDLVKIMKKHLKRDRKGIVTIKGEKPKVEEEKPEKVVGASVQDRVASLQSRIDKLKGGQLPSSVREKLEGMEMKLKGGTVSEKPKKRITPVNLGPVKSAPPPVQEENSQFEDYKEMMEYLKKGLMREEAQKGSSKGQKTEAKLTKGLIEAAEKGEAMEKSIQPRKKEPKKAAPEKAAPKRKEPCEIKGYSKLKKAELIDKVGKALREKGQHIAGLEKESVAKLRALAREHCGYKPVEKKHTEKEKEAAEALLSLKTDDKPKIPPNPNPNASLVEQLQWVFEHTGLVSKYPNLHLFSDRALQALAKAHLR